MMNIPFVNLSRMHDPIREDIDRVVKQVIDDNNYINGKQIDDFEKHYAQFLGVKEVIGVNSGTDALFLALKLLELQPGDHVVSVPHTFIATTEAVTMAGGRVLFVDVDETTGNMSPQKLETFIKDADPVVREKIKAIIFVSLYGNPEGLDQVFQIAKANNIALISDAAQAHGALIDNRPITDFADITTYSFFPGKNLGAFGDAGAIAINNPGAAETLRMLRNHGRKEKYLHPLEAFNCRIDTLQAAILDVKLNSLDQWNQNRIAMARLYNELLAEKGYFVPPPRELVKAVFHIYATRVNNRDTLQNQLKTAGIATGVHYPVPLHLQPAYRYLGYQLGDFPVSEKLAQTVLSLPIDGTITAEEIDYICQQFPPYKG